MSEIVMGKQKRVGDNIFVTDIGEGMHVIGKPDVVKNPMNGKLEKISDVILTHKNTHCPSCKEENGPGIEITITETNLGIYACKKCLKFIWFSEKKLDIKEKK